MATAKPARPRIDDVRDVALTVFAERGYHGTTMSAIAELVGMRVPSLYSHIRSKQDLLVEIAVQTTEAVLAEYEAAVAGLTDPAERLRRAVAVYALRHATHRREALVVNRDVSSLEEPARGEVLHRIQRHEHAIRAIIADGVAAGLFTTGTPALTSFAILEMSVSIARWFDEDGPLSAEAVAGEYADLALNMVRAPLPTTAPAA
jgi:AcrR family transcriptional regulator